MPDNSLAEAREKNTGELAFMTMTMSTQRLHSRSFLGLPYKILNVNLKKELLWSPWVLSSIWPCEGTEVLDE